MERWKHNVNFKAFWNDENMSMEDKGKQAAIMLKPLLKYSFKDDSELEEIIEMFECVSGDGEPPETTEFTATEDFDATCTNGPTTTEFGLRLNFKIF